MREATLVALKANLQALKLAGCAGNIETYLRQATEARTGYDEFLLDLTAHELQARSMSRERRRIREAKFPLIKPLETFDLNATPVMSDN